MIKGDGTTTLETSVKSCLIRDNLRETLEVGLKVRLLL